MTKNTSSMSQTKGLADYHTAYVRLIVRSYDEPLVTE